MALYVPCPQAYQTPGFDCMVVIENWRWGKVWEGVGRHEKGYIYSCIYTYTPARQIVGPTHDQHNVIAGQAKRQAHTGGGILCICKVSHIIVLVYSISTFT